MNPPDMTLRDWFAGQVAAGLHAMGRGTFDDSGRESYMLADALLRAREVPSAVPTLADKQNAPSGQAGGNADDLAASAVILGQCPGKTFTITSTDDLQ